MKLNYFSLFLLISFLVASGCQSTGAVKENGVTAGIETFEQITSPPENLSRSEETPLVAAIPGLNAPLAPVGHNQFGNLIQLLNNEGIPAFVVAYDEKIHPVSRMSGLFSKEHSISINRVLPILSSGIIQENQIRAKQNLAPLKELTLISYSQGSVLTFDLLRYIFGFRIDWQNYIKETGNEWEFLKNDPEFLLFKEQAQNFITLKYIIAQSEQKLILNYFLKRFSERLSQKLAQSILRLKNYLETPELIFPDQKIVKGNSPGYPRRYPKTWEWISNINKNSSLANNESALSFWMKYVEFEQFLPLQIRVFSMAGSFFGSPEANKATGVMETFPLLADVFAGDIQEQVKDTRLGTRDHLSMVKAILKYHESAPGIKAQNNVHFIIGANGKLGDGLVGQSSAHTSAHLFSQISFDSIRQAENHAVLTPEIKQLPRYPVTALKVHHLPENHLIKPNSDAVAYIRSPENVTYPFLLAFVKKDFEKLRELHIKENRKLYQFMVVVDLPLEIDFKQYRVDLIPQSDDLDITGRYYNKSSHSIVWTGRFKNGKYLNWFKESDKDESLVVKISENKGKTVEIPLEIDNGINHFLQITGKKGNGQEPYLLGMPRVFEWTPEGIKVKLAEDNN